MRSLVFIAFFGEICVWNEARPRPASSDPAEYIFHAFCTRMQAEICAASQRGPQVMHEAATLFSESPPS
jgi:hypothetical protein